MEGGEISDFLRNSQLCLFSNIYTRKIIYLIYLNKVLMIVIINDNRMINLYVGMCASALIIRRVIKMNGDAIFLLQRSNKLALLYPSVFID